MSMNLRHDRHSRPRISICKDSSSSVLKYGAFLYIHAQLPNGELVALRFRSCDDHILRCDRPRRGPSCAQRRSSRIVIGDIAHTS